MNINGGGVIHEERIPNPSVNDRIGALVRGKWIILLSLAGALICASAYLWVAKPVYKATASLLVNSRSVQSSLFLDAVRRGGEEKNLVQNELEVLKSRSVTLEVAKQLIRQKNIDTLGLMPIQIVRDLTGSDSGSVLADIDEIVRRLEKAVTIESVPETDVITITAKSHQPEESALIANLYADVDYNRNLTISRSKSRSFREFLEGQVSDKRQALLAIEDSLRGYMRRRGIVSLDGESKKLIDQLARLEAQRDETDITIQAENKSLASYGEQVPQQEKEVARAIGEANDPYIRLLQEQLAKLEVQRDVTIAQNPTMSEKEIYSDRLKEVDTQIGALKEKLEKRTSEFLSGALPATSNNSGSDPAGYLKQLKQKILETRINLQSLKARRSALNESIRQYEALFGMIPGKAIEYARLERAKSTAEKLYIAVVEKYNEATITEQSQFGYLDVIDRADAPDRPSSPNMLLILVFGAAIGLSGGVLAVFIKERLDQRVQSPDELRQRKYSLAGTILRAGDGLNKKGEHSLAAITMPFSAYAESYRQLHAHLRFAQSEHRPRTILFTSAKPEDGKTTVVANLGGVIARSGQRVLLIDADLRKPALHRYFKLEPVPGLNEFLSGKLGMNQIVRPSGIEHLSVVPAGIADGDPSVLLASDQMQRMLLDLMQSFDLILMDSSPVLASSDPSALASMAEEVFLVVRAGDTRLAEMEEALDLLGEIRGKKPAVVLNGFDARRAYGIPYGRSTVGSYYTYTHDKKHK